MVKILKRLNAHEWMQAGVSLLFIITQVWLDLKMPEYTEGITALVMTPGSVLRDIWIEGGKMLLCALGSVTSSVAVGFFAARIAASFSMRLRSLLFSKVESFSMEEINRFSTPSLITRSTNDVTQVQMLITMGLQMLIKAPITAGWAISKIVGKGVEWSLATAAAVLIMLLTALFMTLIVIPKFRKMQTLTDNLTRVARDNLTGLRVVRAYNAEQHQTGKFEEANEDLTSAQLFTTRAMSVMMPIMTIVMGGISLAIYWIGAVMIDRVEIPGDMQGVVAALTQRGDLFANMVAFIGYAMQIIMSFMLLVIVFVLLPRASVSAKRINEVLEAQPSIIEGDKTDGLPGLSGEVEFRNVSFKYPDAAEYVLQDVSFKAKRGETVAFIGSTGSGKSTLINLVPRFFDASDGEVLVDGVNVKEYRMTALYNKIGYVPQKAVLFKGTVTSNVAYGDNGGAGYSEEDVRTALRIAQGSGFVEKMENTYDAEISQDGTNVSGGQKQRLAIARAICRKPEIYIFDDSFSALDYKTDRVLRDALKQEASGITSLIVAQRVGTIMGADRIVVLDEGKVVGIGSHSELLDNCEIYKEIAMSQLSEGELIS